MTGRHTQGGGRAVTEADTGVTQLLAKDAKGPWPPLDAKSTKEGFWPAELRENNYIVLSHPLCGKIRGNEHIRCTQIPGNVSA